MKKLLLLILLPVCSYAEQKNIYVTKSECVDKRCIIERPHTDVYVVQKDSPTVSKDTYIYKADTEPKVERDYNAMIKEILDSE